MGSQIHMNLLPHTHNRRQENKLPYSAVHLHHYDAQTAISGEPVRRRKLIPSLSPPSSRGDFANLLTQRQNLLRMITNPLTWHKGVLDFIDSFSWSCWPLELNLSLAYTLTSAGDLMMCIKSRDGTVCLCQCSEECELFFLFPLWRRGH